MTLAPLFEGCVWLLIVRSLFLLTGGGYTIGHISLHSTGYNNSTFTAALLLLSLHHQKKEEEFL